MLSQEKRLTVRAIVKKEKLVDKAVEKAKKQARKQSFFETMGNQIDRIVEERHREEDKNRYRHSQDQMEQRRLVNKKLTVS